MSSATMNRAPVRLGEVAVISHRSPAPKRWLISNGVGMALVVGAVSIDVVVVDAVAFGDRACELKLQAAVRATHVAAAIATATIRNRLELTDPRGPCGS